MVQKTCGNSSVLLQLIEQYFSNAINRQGVDKMATAVSLVMLQQFVRRLFVGFGWSLSLFHDLDGTKKRAPASANW